MISNPAGWSLQHIMRIGTEELTVAGFLRDSQMNSMMASSKRFLVSETDFFMKKMIA